MFVKYLVGCALLLVLLCLLLLGDGQRSGSAMDSRGDKQFSFSGSDSSEYPEKGNNTPSAPPTSSTDQNQANDLSRAPNSAAPTDASSDSGSSGDAQNSRLKTGMGEDSDTNHLDDGQAALRRGQSAGQTSNVPGTTSTSPNGTSNIYGTGGVPLFPSDLPSRALTPSGAKNGSGGG